MVRGSNDSRLLVFRKMSCKRWSVGEHASASYRSLELSSVSKVGPARFHPTSRDKWAKSVTKGEMVNNFPTTTLMKNRFALKGRLGCSEHLRANRFLINPVFEELFKRLCLSYHVCSGSLSSQWCGCSYWPYLIRSK